MDALCKLKVVLMPSCPDLIKDCSHESEEIEKLPKNVKLRSAASRNSDKETLRTK